MKNILILNNSYSEIDLINNILDLKKFNLFTAGYNIPFVKKNITHFNVDYTNTKFLKKIIQKKKIDLVIPCANDLSLYSAKKLKKNNLIDKKKTLDILINKFCFRKFYKKIPYYSLDVKKKFLNNFPLLLKKKISSGGKSILKIDNLKSLKKIKVKKNDYFLEKFIKGSDHGVFTLIKNKKIKFSFFDNEQRYINPYTVSSTSSHTDLPFHIREDFLKKILKIVLDLQLVDGILHFQIKYNKAENKIYIIEVTRRIPGDRYLKFIEYVSGINISKLYINFYLKKKLLKQNIAKSNYILRKMIFSKKNGKFIKITFKKTIQNKIIDSLFILKKGEKIKDFMNQRIAIIFFKFKNKSELKKYTNNIEKYIKVTVK